MMFAKEVPLLKIGHRGAPMVVRENTLASLKEAIRLGADAVECDVRRSKDGVWFLYHSPAVKWMRIHLTAFAELGRGTELTTLAEVLAWSRETGARVIFDVKARKDVGELCGEISRSGAEEFVTFSSFHHNLIPQVQDRFPKMETALIVGSFWYTFFVEGEETAFANLPLSIKPLRAVDRALRLGARAIHVKQRLVSRALVERAHAAGLQVRVWTVNEFRGIAKFKEMDVDGIISNYPERL